MRLSVKQSCDCGDILSEVCSPIVLLLTLGRKHELTFFSQISSCKRDAGLSKILRFKISLQLSRSIHPSASQNFSKSWVAGHGEKSQSPNRFCHLNLQTSAQDSMAHSWVLLGSRRCANRSDTLLPSNNFLYLRQQAGHRTYCCSEKAGTCGGASQARRKSIPTHCCKTWVSHT